MFAEGIHFFDIGTRLQQSFVDRSYFVQTQCIWCFKENRSAAARDNDHQMLIVSSFKMFNCMFGKSNVLFTWQRMRSFGVMNVIEMWIFNDINIITVNDAITELFLKCFAVACAAFAKP